MSKFWAQVVTREERVELRIHFDDSPRWAYQGLAEVKPGEDAWGIPYEVWLEQADQERVDVATLVRERMGEGPDVKKRMTMAPPPV